MRFVQFALYFGFGVFLAHIGFSATTWQFWVAVLFLASIDVVSFIKGKTR